MAGAREKILSSLRKALENTGPHPQQPDMESPIYVKHELDIFDEFAETFEARKGKIFLSNTEDQLRQDLFAFLQERKFPQTFVWEPQLIEMLKPMELKFQTDDRNLASVEIGITLCECMVARTGSLIVSSKQRAGRRLTIYPPIHVVIGTSSQILPDIADGLAFMRKKYGQKLPSMISLVTGASRTADIEKTLVLGAHGPRELYLFLIDDLIAS